MNESNTCDFDKGGNPHKGTKGHPYDKKGLNMKKVKKASNMEKEAPHNEKKRPNTWKKKFQRERLLCLPIISLIVKLSTWPSKNENIELNLRENKFICIIFMIEICRLCKCHLVLWSVSNFEIQTTNCPKQYNSIYS